MSRKIAWEKWYDAESEEDFINEMEEAILDDDVDFSNNDDIEMQGGIDINTFLNSMTVNTPLGKYHLNDKLLPTKMFDCWIGHTNFDITKKEEKILNTASGVECLKVISRYRFFIGIGKLFDFSCVRGEIQRSLLIDSYSEKTEGEEMSDIINSVKGNKKWAVFIGNDGSIQKIISNKDDCAEYNASLQNLLRLKNGNIIMSDNV